MFERTLSDLIRGLRASSKKNEPQFISLATNDVRSEVRSEDMKLKAAAILKPTYLDMLGYDMSWASFCIAEDKSSSKIHLKVVLMKYPEVLPHSFNPLREKLDDPDSGAVSATVNVLCELARRDAQYYLPFAPQLFDIVSKSSNNWMLIKVIKPVKKLQKPVTDLMSTTPAVSLLYECVHTCTIGGMVEGPGGNSLAKTCIDKLAAFLRDPDQNCELCSGSSCSKTYFPPAHLVAAHQDEIISSIEDQDISIRTHALDLVSSLVSLNGPETACAPSSQERATSALPTATHSLTPAAVATSDMSLAMPVTVQMHQSHPRYSLPLTALEFAGALLPYAYENVAYFEWYLRPHQPLIELASPQELAPLLLQPNIMLLPEETIAVYFNVYTTQQLNIDQLYSIAINDSAGEYDPLTRLRSGTFYGRPGFKFIYTRIRGAIESGSFLGPRAEWSIT
ncbi:hypothetical protein BS47DRAFT_1400282 [Hydnum rufescens UP504]|uniref:Clathrin/coatomer adaptor adaptin-like N-terminal domain-containing protein n=1 Tax=Hydnum rufescens UP504 TaxID=1448309 RepID=A0A9P6DL54_9AGAM|nr:hypothetical protein BS47DRAFT_1400282 [Hydnum rufescens UP504]